MSKKKARLIICSNVDYNQYFNLYLHKKPLVNKFNKLKETLLYNRLNNDVINCESLQYSILQSHSIFLNNFKNRHRVNNVLSIYLKKYYSNILHYGNINIDGYYKRNIIINKSYNLYHNFYIGKLNYSNINYKYKSTSNYFINRNTIFYSEIQNENKLLNRKVNISKYQILIII